MTDTPAWPEPDPTIEVIRRVDGEDVADCPFVLDREWFDDLDEPTEVRVDQYKHDSTQVFVIHPTWELCDKCAGECELDGVVCGRCSGSGGHPLAGTWEPSHKLETDERDT